MAPHTREFLKVLRRALGMVLKGFDEFLDADERTKV